MTVGVEEGIRVGVNVIVEVGEGVSVREREGVAVGLEVDVGELACVNAGRGVKANVGEGVEVQALANPRTSNATRVIFLTTIRVFMGIVPPVVINYRIIDPGMVMHFTTIVRYKLTVNSLSI